MFFCKNDFLEGDTEQEVHKILDDHIKKEHQYGNNPQFSVRTAKVLDKFSPDMKI